MQSIKTLNDMIVFLQQRGDRKRVAVICANDASTRYAVEKGQEMGFIEPIYVNGDDKDECARRAVALCKNGEADILMKGLVNTDIVLRAILNKETGILRPGHVLTHIAMAEIPKYEKLLFFTDAAVIPIPTKEQRRQQVHYVNYVCHALGIEEPRISLIHCAEKVSEKTFPYTKDYLDIIALAQSGYFGRCIIDGPLDLKTSLDSVSLREKGIPTYMFDVSVTPASEIVAAVFRYSHLVLASTTYNAGIFVQMESFLYDLAAHNIQNRTVAIIENGSWAPTSGKLMRELMEKCRNMNVLNETLTIKSALKEDQLAQLDAIADAIDATIEKKTEVTEVEAAPEAAVYTPVLDANAMFKLSYGLFILTAKDGAKDNGCIINTASQVTAQPNRITIAVNKNNYTHDMIKKTGIFNVSVLSQDVTFDAFRHFGFQSGRDTDKFAGYTDADRSANGLYYVTRGVNALISGKVIEEREFETHTLFIADVTECRVLSDEPSVTYAYYFEHIKPKPQPAAEEKTVWVCKICGYEYEGEEIPEDFICPLCKHPASDFEKA